MASKQPPERPAMAIPFGKSRVQSLLNLMPRVMSWDLTAGLRSCRTPGSKVNTALSTRPIPAAFHNVVPTFAAVDVVPPPPKDGYDERTKGVAAGVIYYEPTPPPPTVFDYLESQKDSCDKDNAALSINKKSLTSSSAAGSSIVASHTNWGELSLGLSYPLSKGSGSAPTAIGTDHIFCSRGGDSQSGAFTNTSLDILAFPEANWGPHSGPALPLSTILADKHFVGAYTEMRSLDQLGSENFAHFVGTQVGPELCISRTWMRRCGPLSAMKMTPYCNSKIDPGKTKIGHRCSLAEERRFLDNVENGLQFGLDITATTTIHGGVIVLSGNPGTAPPGACEHYDEFLTQNVHAIIVSLLQAGSPSRNVNRLERRCFFICCYNAEDARMLLGMDNAVIQPISYRGSLFPPIIIPFNMVAGTLRSMRYGVCNVNVDKGTVFHGSTGKQIEGSSRVLFSPAFTQACLQWTCRVSYPRNPFWSAHWEGSQVWDDPTTSGGVAHSDLSCSQPSLALLISDMKTVLTLGVEYIQCYWDDIPVFRSALGGSHAERDEGRMFEDT